MDKWVGRLKCLLRQHHWEMQGQTFTVVVYVCSRCYTVKETAW